MFCRNCGAYIPEGNAFCEECGEPVRLKDPAKKQTAPQGKEAPRRHAPQRPASQSEPQPRPAQSQRPAPQQPAQQPTKPGRRKAIIAIAAALVVCIGGITGMLIRGSDADYTQKLTTARQYVDEQKLDQAETAYLELIDMEPKKEAAYLELSDIYVIQARYEESIAILNQGLQATGKKEVFEKPITKTKKKYEGVWKTAYRDVLQEHQTWIETYEYRYSEYEEPTPSAALGDVTGDGVPELFFMEIQGEEYESGLLHVYTYSGGEARELEVPYTRMDLQGPSDMDDVFADVAAASGTTYAIFISKKGRLVICSTIADEGSELSTCEYTAGDTSGDDLTFAGEHWDEVMSVNFTDSGEFAGETRDYYHGKETISREEFDKEQQRLADEMDKLLLTNVEGEWDNVILNKAGRQESERQFCADLIEALKVKEAKAPAAKGSGYDSVIEEYTQVFEKIRSGEYALGDDEDVLGELDYVPESFLSGVGDPTFNEYNTDVHLQFARKDLNGDGTEELMTGCISGGMETPAIDSIFTLNKNGEPVRLISASSFLYRSSLSIYQDGTIEHSGSSGATAQSYEFYVIDKTGSLKESESFITESGDENNETIIYKHNNKEVSEEDFRSLLDEKHAKAGSMKLEWTDR